MSSQSEAVSAILYASGILTLPSLFATLPLLPLPPDTPITSHPPTPRLPPQPANTKDKGERSPLSSSAHTSLDNLIPNSFPLNFVSSTSQPLMLKLSCCSSSYLAIFKFSCFIENYCLDFWQEPTGFDLYGNIYWTQVVQLSIVTCFLTS